MKRKILQVIVVTLVCAGAGAQVNGNGSSGWLIKTYRNGSPVSGLADADALINGNFVIATTNLAEGDMVGFNSGEGTGHFGINNPVPGIPNNVATDNYAVQGTGFLNVPAPGQYTFGLNTDDGARLRIDGANIIIDDVRTAPHDSTCVTVSLSAGIHSIEWTWFNEAGGVNGGGAEGEIFSASGVHSGFDSSFQLIGSAPGLIVSSTPPAQYVLQPGPYDSKDIWTTSFYPYTDCAGYGTGGGLNDYLLRVGGWGDLYYSLLQFDLIGLPTNAISAVLYLYCENLSGGGTPLYLDQITQAWDWQTSGTGCDHDRLWWADKPSTTQWLAGQLPTPTQGQWYAVDITDLYNAWKNGTYPNYGLQVRPVLNSNNNFDEFYSGDYTNDPTLRPKLVITASGFNPLPLGAIQAISNAVPVKPTYGSLTKEPGKDSLIVITHGLTWKVEYPFSPPDPTWIDDMSNNISQYLIAQHLTNWQVVGYKWVANSWRVNPEDALNNAKQEGVTLGNYIVPQGWTHVHLISHSVGAGLIQACSEWVKAISPVTVVHCTFLDPFVGLRFEEQGNYGNGADWADNYYTKDSETGGDILPLTQSILSHAYNVDVTGLDTSDRVIQIGHFFSSPTGVVEPCYQTESVHGWPIDFYSNTITGNTNLDYAGFGFPLSEEGGNWSYALGQYTPGDSRTLGASDPCPEQLYTTTPMVNGFTPDFTGSPSQQSTAGLIETFFNGTQLTTVLSPAPQLSKLIKSDTVTRQANAWLATFIMITNPVNTVSFDAQFLSDTGAEGLLSVYWDTNVVGTIDEVAVQPGLQHYTLTFPNASANSVHMLGFRLDSFSTAQSSVVVTNVVMGYTGVSQPFTLNVTTNTFAGLPVFQLNGQLGFDYTVQASTNLINWTTIAVLSNTNGTVQFFDQNSTGFGQRFYRAVTPY